MVTLDALLLQCCERLVPVALFALLFSCDYVVNSVDNFSSLCLVLLFL